MLFSIIIISHDKPRYVHEAIQSVVLQTYTEWEAIVVDSGVLFDSRYFQRFPWRPDQRVRIIRSEETEEIRKNTTVASWCTNECFRKNLVHGELVMYLCDDDILYPHTFEAFVDFVERNPHVLAVYGSEDVGWVRSDGTSGIYFERRATKIAGRCCGGQSLDCQVDYLQLCHRRELLRFFPSNEYWPESAEVRWHADGVFLEKIGMLTPIYPVDVKVGMNRRTPQSLNGAIADIPVTAGKG